MGTHTQHIPVTAPTCASPVGEWQCHIPGGDQELAASAGARGSPHPGDSTENSAATAAPHGIYPVGFTCWDLPSGIYPLGFTSESCRGVGPTGLWDFPYWLYDGTETKTLFPKGRPKVKAQPLTQTPVLGFGLAGKQEGEGTKLLPAKLPIYTTEREFTATEIFYSRKKITGNTQHCNSLIHLASFQLCASYSFLN